MAKFIVIKLCLLIIYSSFPGVVPEIIKDEDLQDGFEREGRVIIRIRGTSCPAGGAEYPRGYCDGWFSCYANKGLTLGICPHNPFASCCIVKKSCGGTIDVQTAYFQSRNYPSVTYATGACAVTIEKNYWDITQVRLDFIAFDLAGPNTQGKCDTESMVVTGGDASFPVPTICGNNKGQHMYVNFDGDNPITVTFNIVGEPIDTTKWSIQVTQYRNSDPGKAPEGCVQYFTDRTGVLISNFGSEIGTASLQHLQSQEYDICVQKTLNPCSITWHRRTLDISTSTANGDVCVGMSGTGGSQALDYIAIEGAPYCAPNAGPDIVANHDYRMHVSFDGNETPEAAGTGNGRSGFIFSYTRNC